MERKLSRYIGFIEPKISRLSTLSWQRTKKIIKEEAEKLGLDIGPDKEMFKILSKLDKKFAYKIKNFYKASNMKAKKEILGELVVYIDKKSNGLLPEKWAIK